METITSVDGTQVAYARSGAGSPLVLVHGTMQDQASSWGLVRAAFEAKFTVYAIDLRGRGESGRGVNHTIEREFEDVAVLVDSIAEPVHLLGHSYGAHCALAATALTPNIRSLVLYEPPAGKYTSAEIVDAMYVLLEQGDNDGVIVTFMRDLVQVPEDQLDLLRATPLWPQIVSRAPTIPPEVRAIREYKFDPANFAGVQQPTLLLVGGASDPSLREVNEQLHKVVPRSQLVELPGQQHAAMFTAPDLFASTVCDFLAKIA